MVFIVIWYILYLITCLLSIFLCYNVSSIVVVVCCLVTQSPPILDCSVPGFPVLHHLLDKFVQTHVHWVGDAIQPSWPLSPASPSVTCFSFCPQSLPTSESFPVNQLFASGGQSIGASASVLPMNILGWFPLGWTCLISFLFKGLKSLLQHNNLLASILFFFMVQVSHPYMTAGYLFCKYFLLISGLMYHFVSSVFSRSKVLILMKLNLSNF